MHTYLHSYIHTLYTYIYTCLHTYIHTREGDWGESGFGDGEDGERREGERTTEHTRETRERGRRRKGRGQCRRTEPEALKFLLWNCLCCTRALRKLFCATLRVDLCECSARVQVAMRKFCVQDTALFPICLRFCALLKCLAQVALRKRSAQGCPCARLKQEEPGNPKANQPHSPWHVDPVVFRLKGPKANQDLSC